MYILDLSSVHQIGKDLKCCLVEDYHWRSMNLITAGYTGHICKAPFKRLLDCTAWLSGWLNKPFLFPGRKPSCCQSKDVISVLHLLTATLIPEHPPLAYVYLFQLSSSNTTVFPFTQLITNSSANINNQKIITSCHLLSTYHVITTLLST